VLSEGNYLLRNCNMYHIHVIPASSPYPRHSRAKVWKRESILKDI